MVEGKMYFVERGLRRRGRLPKPRVGKSRGAALHSGSSWIRGRFVGLEQKATEVDNISEAGSSGGQAASASPNIALTASSWGSWRPSGAALRLRSFRGGILVEFGSTGIEEMGEGKLNFV